MTRSQSWPRPGVFEWLQREGNVAREEMFRTFNCGIGYTVIVADAARESTIAALGKLGLDAVAIGEVVPASGSERVRIA